MTVNTPFIPPPKPRTRPTTYSVVVHEVPVKELLLALARDTKENIDIHPGLQGLVSLNAIDETLPSILERISRQVNMRYRIDGRTIVVEPDAPYMKTYKVNYVNMTRDTTSSISCFLRRHSRSSPSPTSSRPCVPSPRSTGTRSTPIVS